MPKLLSPIEQYFLPLSQNLEKYKYVIGLSPFNDILVLLLSKWIDLIKFYEVEYF